MLWKGGIGIRHRGAAGGRTQDERHAARAAGGGVMADFGGGIIVGVLGQWASGKSTAVKTLIGYLGGADKVVLIDDRALFAGQAVNHLLELQDSQVKRSIEEDGTQRLEGELSTVWLDPGEALQTVDWGTLRFAVGDDVLPAWLNRARVEVGRQIRGRFAEGKPIVVEAGFGQNPADHTLADLFAALEEAGVGPNQVKWMLVEASYEKRSERNRKRQPGCTGPTGPPEDVFARYAAHGGDLDPDHRRRLEAQGTIIKRVSNEHDDVERFRSDIIAAFEGMFGGV